MSETPVPPPTPIVNRVTKPLGVLPKNIQPIAMGVIAVLMVLVIAFSSRSTPKKPTTMPVPQAPAVDPNEARIREYREQLDAQVERLAQEQAKLRDAQGSINPLVPPAVPPGAGGDAGYGVYRAQGAGSDPSMGTGPRQDWRAVDRERRHESRYASNVVLSRRPESRTSSQETPGGVAWSGAVPATPTTASPAADAVLQQASGPLYRLFEGQIIETVLVNRLNSAFAGPIDCQVTTHVFSRDRTKLLIPQGSRVLGTVRRVDSFGQERLAVAFDRLIMPDGYSIELKSLPGLGHVGETGLLDQVNRHYAQLFGVSLAIGAIGGLSQAGTSYGPGATSTDAYRQGVSGSFSQTSLNILDRYLNVLPTFTVREGHRVKVYLTGDVLLPAYDNHQLPRDL